MGHFHTRAQHTRLTLPLGIFCRQNAPPQRLCMLRARDTWVNLLTRGDDTPLQNMTRRRFRILLTIWTTLTALSLFGSFPHTQGFFRMLDASQQKSEQGRQCSLFPNRPFRAQSAPPGPTLHKAYGSTSAHPAFALCSKVETSDTSSPYKYAPCCGSRMQIIIFIGDCEGYEYG